MCEPMTLLSFAVSAGSSIMGYMAQEDQAKQQDAIYEQNRRNALAAFQDKQVANNNRIQQERTAAAEQKFETNLDVRAAQSTALVSAGESGVSGLSIEGLLGDFQGRGSRANDRVDQQTEWTMQQLQAEKKAEGYEAVSRINSVAKGQHPSFLDAGLRIVGSGIGAMNTSTKNKLNSLAG